MAGATHLGVGLAAKRIAPRAPLGMLVLGAYFLDVIWGILFLARIEHYPSKEHGTASPWSHGLFMATIWSGTAGLLAARVSRSARGGLFAGLLVFSHWLVDFIAKPMRYTFPADTGLPLLFAGSRTVGLGLWGSRVGTNIGEYGSLLVGLAIYVLTVMKIRKEAKSRAAA